MHTNSNGGREKLHLPYQSRDCINNTKNVHIYPEL